LAANFKKKKSQKEFLTQTVSVMVTQPLTLFSAMSIEGKQAWDLLGNVRML
jgi:hypothetical protein